MSDAVLVCRADITTVTADALINAANSALVGGGGVDGAVHRAAGSSLAQELAAIRGGCPTGRAVITGGGQLPVRYVIHAVGPIWRGGENGEEELLRSAYRSAFALAAEHGCRQVTSAGLSMGIYGYPLLSGAAVAISEAIAAVSVLGLRRITFCVISDEAETAFSAALEQLHPPD